MKTVFIKIDDISEINTSKISVHDLNNRYIDKDGKMYGLKYNRKTRKVSITRIIRTTTKSAEYYNQILKSPKKEGKPLKPADPEKTTVSVIKPAPNIKNTFKKPSFDLNYFISETTGLMHSHKDRIAGIMMNIKNSRMVQERDKTNMTQLNDLFRNLEIDGIGRLDRELTTHKEIKNFPRSLSYYMSKLDSKNRRIIDELDTDSRKMSFAYAVEMYYSIKSLYRTLLKILNDLNDFMDKVSPGGPKDITNAERQYFIDAKTSVDNTIEEISVLFEDLKKFEEYINDINNF